MLKHDFGLAKYELERAMMGDRSTIFRPRFARNDIQRADDIRRATSVLKLPIYLGLLQALLMCTYTAFFLSNSRASDFVFEKLNFFYGYIPILYRYGAVFAARERLDEFHALFSIHLFNAILQCIVMIVLVCFLYRNVRGRRPDHLGFKKGILFFITLLFIAAPSVDLIFGIGDIRNPGFFSNIYIRCLTVPVFNFLFYFIIYGRFWESYYRRSILNERTEIIE